MGLLLLVVAVLVACRDVVVGVLVLDRVDEAGCACIRVRAVGRGVVVADLDAANVFVASGAFSPAAMPLVGLPVPNSCPPVLAALLLLLVDARGVDLYDDCECVSPDACQLPLFPGPASVEVEDVVEDARTDALLLSPDDCAVLAAAFPLVADDTTPAGLVLAHVDVDRASAPLPRCRDFASSSALRPGLGFCSSCDVAWMETFSSAELGLAVVDDEGIESFNCFFGEGIREGGGSIDMILLPS